MENLKEWYVAELVSRTVSALRANSFDAKSFSGAQDLISEVMGYVSPGMKVGLSGSVTLRQIGLVEALRERDVLLLDIWQEGLSDREILETRVRHLMCDLFLSGANAITEKGEIVNVDGVGNRVNSITFGPGKVIIVAGYNKIVADVAAALDRIKRVAAPMNAKRMGLPLPCAETGHCQDCKSEMRICRVLSIMQRRPSTTDISVFLVNEELGF